MPHLAATRKGWENERLASYILSRIAFVSSPLSIGDDLGSDFLCNLFEAYGTGRSAQLVPRIAFAIQIKSSGDTIPLTGKIEYLKNLEVPFFVGVINQGLLTLTIYSGEYLPMLFAAEGIPNALSGRLVRGRFDRTSLFKKLGKGRVQLRLPYVLRLSARASQQSRIVQAARLHDRCRMIQRNIFGRRSEEHIYEEAGRLRPMLMAGPGSAQHFRLNFQKRLAEAFVNVGWLADNRPGRLKPAEFQVYEQCYQALAKLIAAPEFLKRARRRAHTAMAEWRRQSGPATRNKARK